MWMIPGLAILAVLITSVYAMLMVRRRDAGLVTANQYLIVSMAFTAAAGIGFWELWTEQPISVSGAIIVSSAWFSTAAASRNYRVNPGVVFFALTQTAAVASVEIDRQQQIPFWVAPIVALLWLIVGYGVRYDKGSPGWLCLALIAGILMVHEAMRF